MSKEVYPQTTSKDTPQPKNKFSKDNRVGRFATLGMLGAISASAAMAQEAAPRTIDVDSKLLWQGSGYVVDSDRSIVAVRDNKPGGWTVDLRSYRKVDGAGYTDAEDKIIGFDACKYDQDIPHGVMMGNLDGEIFPVGRGTVIEPRHDQIGAEVLFAINDQCTGDNEGKLPYRVQQGDQFDLQGLMTRTTASGLSPDLRQKVQDFGANPNACNSNPDIASNPRCRKLSNVLSATIFKPNGSR